MKDGLSVGSKTREIEEAVGFVPFYFRVGIGGIELREWGKSMWIAVDLPLPLSAWLRNEWLVTRQNIQRFLRGEIGVANFSKRGWL